MADLAATDITITLLKAQIVRGSPGHQSRNIVRVAFGDGALTYPANGVPLPAFSSFGMRKKLDYLVPIDAGSPVGENWKYDYTNGKLRGWTVNAGALAEMAGAVAAQSLVFEAVGW